jgi:hypothetical protein
VSLLRKHEEREAPVRLASRLRWEVGTTYWRMWSRLPCDPVCAEWAGRTRSLETALTDRGAA